ncbi:MAG: RDD family protein [Mycoplasma sp.]|nr:RDD family protein [Mycoplasma sp.]
MEKQKVFYTIGFWRRALARLIDLLLVFVFSYLILFICVVKINSVWEFRESYLFYIWALSTVALLLIEMVLIPILTKGYTFGFWSVKIKVESTNNNYINTIIKREIFYGFGWAFIMLMVTAVINHTLIFTITRIKSSINGDSNLLKQLSIWDKTRISIVGSFSSILTFIQIFVAITIIPNNENRGFHDRSANAFIIQPKKTKEVAKQYTEKLQPVKINDTQVRWL